VNKTDNDIVIDIKLANVVMVNSYHVFV